MLWGEPREPPSPSWGARHSHLFFVSRMNRKKKRPSTRNTLCRRPRRSARCLRPTCPRSSESAVPASLPPGSCASSQVINPKPVCYLRVPAPCHETSREHSSEQDSLCSQRAIDDERTRITLDSANCCKGKQGNKERNRSWEGYVWAVWEGFSEEVTFKRRPKCV